MTEDLSRYSDERKKYVQDWFKTYGETTGIKQAVGLMAVASGCPAIVVAYWISELTGMNPEITNTIKVLTEFYGYTSIKT